MFSEALLVAVATVQVCNAYFSYSDCPSRCMAAEMNQCIIHNNGDGTYDYECFAEWSDCEDAANDENACVGRNNPTRGGTNFWKEFEKNRPRPPPTPKPATCNKAFWIISSITQTAITITLFSIYASTKLVRMLRRRSYRMITETLPESPPHPYVENTIQDQP